MKNVLIQLNNFINMVIVLIGLFFRVIFTHVPFEGCASCAPSAYSFLVVGWAASQRRWLLPFLEYCSVRTVEIFVTVV